MTYYFTSITLNYMAKAKVLSKTLKAHNKSAKFALAIAEPIPDGLEDFSDYFDLIVTSSELDSIGNKESFLFKHNVTELCTAVKPFVAEKLMVDYGAEKVIYLDPDIAIFNPLGKLDDCLDEYNIVLTPHQTVPESIDNYVVENEILFLKRGVYNLGFFGVKNSEEGLRFLRWWKARLQNYCFDDNYETLPELSKQGLLGLFTDQKWIDLVPAYFDGCFIIKEPGYNVCTWNLTSRRVTRDSSGNFLVNNSPIYFFHFSGYDSGGHHNEMQKNIMHFPSNEVASDLTIWYQAQLDECNESVYGQFKTPYSHYSNGDEIQDFERKIFHMRKDIHHFFNNPFQVDGGFCFYNWIRDEYPEYFNKVEFADSEKNFMSFLLPMKSKRRFYVKKFYHKIMMMFDT